MKDYNQVVRLLNQAVDQTSAYATRPTKAESKRIRATLGEIKKLVTPVRAELVQADKG